MREPGVPWWRELTRYQWVVLIVAWLGWVFDVFDTSLFVLVKQSIVLELVGKHAYDKGGPGTAIEGAIMLVFVLGWALGGLIFGVMADRWGRKRTMIVTILVYCLFTWLTMFCRTWQEVALVRFLTALGIGGEWAAGTALVAEALPDRARAAAAGLLQSAAAIGPMLAALALILLAHQDWRWLFVVGLAPALVTVWIRKEIHEPERWSKAAGDAKRPWFESLAELLRLRRWRRNALIALLLGVVGIIGANNLSYWLPNLVRAASPGLLEDVIKQRTGLAQMVMHVGTLAGVFLFPSLCERWGRKKALGLFFAVCPVVVVGTTFAGPGFAALLLLAPVMAFFVLGLTAGFPLYFPELFPTRLRGTGLGLCYNTGRILQAPWPLFTGWLAGSVGIGYAVGLTALVYVVGAAIMPFAPETRGRPLPD